MREEVLKATHLQYIINHETILKDVSFAAFKGEFLTFIGANGVGKTVLAQIICGQRRLSGGTLSYGGVPEKKIRSRNFLGYMPENAQVFGHLTIAESLYVGSNSGFRSFFNTKKLYEKAEQFIKKFGLKMEAHQYMSELTSSKKKIVMLLRYLINPPEMLVIDSAIDSCSFSEAVQFKKILSEIKSKGTTIFYFTFNYSLIADLTDRILLLEEGIIAYEANKRASSSDDINKLVSTKGYSERSEKALEKQAGNGGEILLQLKDFAAEHVPRTNLVLRKGELVGIIGLPNSKISLFFDSLVGINPITGGQFIWKGKSVRFKSPYEAVKAGIHFCSDDIEESIWGIPEPVRCAVSLPVMDKITSGIFLNTKYEKIMLEECFREINLDIDINRSIDTLNYANYAKMKIAGCLVSRPDLLILNKITRGLDEKEMDDIYSTLLKIKSRCCILVNLSKLEQELKMCDRVVVWGEKGIEHVYISDENGIITGDVKNEQSVDC